MDYLKVLLPLIALYLAVSANFAPSNILLGAIVAGIVVMIVGPVRGRVRWGRLPGAVVALVRHILRLVVDVIKNGIILARIVLSPSLPIKPGIVAIPSGCKTELGTALSAHAVSITPGELVVEIGADGTMYTHCLDAGRPDAERVNAQGRRRQLIEQFI
jgi:multicomponent Na+:H+ antiporter subunit E